MPTRSRLFLHKTDPATRIGTYVDTTPEALRATPFLDGRTPYWQGAPIEAPLASEAPAAPIPDRMLFHIGFCGSTLLATLLDQPGHTLALREPQALTDLAAYKSTLDRDGRTDPEFRGMLATARAHLRRPWASGEQVVVKPSNWVNNLLPDLTAIPSQVRPLFLTMERRAFARAILRGGPARLAFAARAAVHLANSDETRAASVAQALALPIDADDRLLTLAILLHDFQLALFRAAAVAGGWGATHWLTLEALRVDPAAALAVAAKALAIVPPPPGRMLPDHAKHPGTAFSATAEAAADVAIEADHGARIDRALAWVDAARGLEGAHPRVLSHPVTDTRTAPA